MEERPNYCMKEEPDSSTRRGTQQSWRIESECCTATPPSVSELEMLHVVSHASDFTKIDTAVKWQISCNESQGHNTHERHMHAPSKVVFTS